MYTNTVYSTFTCKHTTLLNKTIEGLYLTSTVSSSLLNLSPSHTLLHKDLTFDTAITVIYMDGRTSSIKEKL